MEQVIRTGQIDSMLLCLNTPLKLTFQDYARESKKEGNKGSSDSVRNEGNDPAASDSDILDPAFLSGHVGQHPEVKFS
jgi:hypothetical protein